MTQTLDRRLDPVRMRAAVRRGGIGWAPAHHGELLQGMFQHEDGSRSRALMTLPHPGIGSRAVFHSDTGDVGTGEVTVARPAGTPELTKVQRAAELTLRALSLPTTGGRVEITSDVPHGLGLGSSTSDVTATIRAVADAHGAVLPAGEVARLAVLAEGACDSVMLEDRVVLFAHRAGRVLETFGQHLPPMVVVGCDTAPGESVDTLDYPLAGYDDREIATFQVLLAATRRAIANGDVRLLGRVATASARINQRFLPKPKLDFLLDLCRDQHGCGVQVAHSGTVAGVIFDPDRPGTAAAVDQCLERMRGEGLEPTGVISPERIAMDESA